MDNKAIIKPFRALLLDVASDLRREEILDLKNLSQVHVTAERLARIDDNDIQELFLALEESGVLADGNFSFIVTCLKRINRVDLAMKCEDFMESKRREKLHGIYRICGVIGPVLLVLFYWTFHHIFPTFSGHPLLDRDFLLMLINEQVAELKEELIRIKSLDYAGLSNRTILSVAALFLFLPVLLYQWLMPCTYYRMKVCREGSIPGHVMTFTFTTFDFQSPQVRGLEFRWVDLVKKLNLDIRPHPDEGMHYYLNYDRCGAGGVLLAASWIDGLPMIRGSEIFAVNEEATNVWYNHYDSWHVYRSARNIRCSHHGNQRYNLKF